MLLSGYLLSSKKPDRRYYAKLPYTLVMYLLATVLTFFFRGYFQEGEMTVGGFFKGLFDYSGLSYSWYVEMYIGLFLIAPFLNILYHNISTRKQKRGFLLVLIFMTSLPYLINVLLRLENGKYAQILPDYWLDFYPITYYFIGCYLKEFPLKLRPLTLALANVACFVANGIHAVLRADGGKFSRGSWTKYGSPVVMLQAVLFFAFFAALSYRNFPPRLAKFLQKVSGLCFGGYLVSGIFDNVLYPHLCDVHPAFREQIVWFLPAVLCVYVCSLTLSWFVNKGYDLLALPWRLIRRKKAAKGE